MNLRPTHWFSLTSLIAAALIIGFFIGPRVPDDRQEAHCVRNVNIHAPFGVSVNCDSPDFILNAADLSTLLAPDAVRQTRPGLIFLAAGLTQVIEPAVDFFVATLKGEGAQLVDIQLTKGSRDIWRDVSQNGFIAAYGAFITLNSLILIGCCLLMMSIMRMVFDQPRLTFASAFLFIPIIANDYTKGFFWSPHTQLLTILCAVAAVWGYMKIRRSMAPSRDFLFLSFLAGLGTTAYAGFVLTVCVWGVAYLLRDGFFTRFHVGNVTRITSICILAICLYALPSYAWYLYVISVNGSYFVYDVQAYTGFAVIEQLRDPAQLSAGMGTLKFFIVTFSRMVIEQGWYVLCALIILALFKKRSNQPQEEANGFAEVWQSTLIFLLLYFIFFILYGTIVPRIAYGMAVALFPVIMVYGAHLLRYKPSLPSHMLAASFAAYGVWVIIKDGPYS